MLKVFDQFIAFNLNFLKILDFLAAEFSAFILKMKI